MTEYYIEWRIELEADSPEDAARKALAIQRDHTSIYAQVFHVGTEGEELEQIDLHQIDMESDAGLQA